MISPPRGLTITLATPISRESTFPRIRFSSVGRALGAKGGSEFLLVPQAFFWTSPRCQLEPIPHQAGVLRGGIVYDAEGRQWLDQIGRNHIQQVGGNSSIVLEQLLPNPGCQKGNPLGQPVHIGGVMFRRCWIQESCGFWKFPSEIRTFFQQGLHFLCKQSGKLRFHQESPGS